MLLEAVQAVDHPVCVGHSTGGEYLLSTPALAAWLKGLVLISTAPDASWMPVFEKMVTENPLPDVEKATARFESEPTDENLRAVAVASAPWNFLDHAVAAGTKLLTRMPYNVDAVRWSAENFDRDYQSAWWPTSVPTLIVSGASDRVVIQSLWRPILFQTPNVTWRVIADAGHFPWIERPGAVRDAFAEVAERIRTRG
ncbi:alpha/beta fold hydrolase [Mycobacterium asiaticum]|uniref:alpha/beta fold hydrolase n=1 Tax=Mycobacterium asiaticum TaxID=1790 RepID=UPI000A894076|nr:alpha/beta hydrolase [Mycobacterium asiaticum]